LARLEKALHSTGIKRHLKLRELPLDLDAVGTLSGHGFHPLKAPIFSAVPAEILKTLGLAGPS
jgi:hypothetical protein